MAGGDVRRLSVLTEGASEDHAHFEVKECTGVHAAFSRFFAAVASSGTLTRLGDAYGIALGAQLAGLVMIYAGFELASQLAPARRASAHSTPVGAG